VSLLIFGCAARILTIGGKQASSVAKKCGYEGAIKTSVADPDHRREKDLGRELGRNEGWDKVDNSTKDAKPVYQ